MGENVNTVYTRLSFDHSNTGGSTFLKHQNKRKGLAKPLFLFEMTLPASNEECDKHQQKLFLSAMLHVVSQYRAVAVDSSCVHIWPDKVQGCCYFWQETQQKTVGLCSLSGFNPKTTLSCFKTLPVRFQDSKILQIILSTSNNFNIRLFKWNSSPMTCYWCFSRVQMSWLDQIFQASVWVLLEVCGFD